MYSSIAGRFEGLTPLPEENCEVCGFYDIENPAVIQRCKELDIPVYWARCRCPETAAELEQKAQDRKVDANLPHGSGGYPRNFGTFRIRDGHNIQKAYEVANIFAKNEGPQILVFVGGTGVGKSHLLEAIGRAYLDRGTRVRYELVGELADAFRHASSVKSEMDPWELLNWYQAFPLLMLDDLGMERTTDFATEKITTLVEDRIMNGGRLVVATNLDKDDIAEHFSARLASRLFDVSDRETTLMIPIAATDYRGLS